MGQTISLLKQVFPPKPKFTDNDIPDLSGKTVIITGSNTGIGKEAARMAYAKGAKVYMMNRSKDKTMEAIKDIQAAVPTSTSSKGQLLFERLDLADLDAVKSAAEAFLAKESQLHVLINNAGVGYPPRGSESKQGHELQLGVNCVGSFSFTKHLTPLLVSTAKTSSTPGSTRVVWVSSSAAEHVEPTRLMALLPTMKTESSITQYFSSKLGNYLHSVEFARRHTATDGIVSVSLNPGNLDSDFWRNVGGVLKWALRAWVLKPPVMGAYTVVFAAFSPEVTLARSGSHIAPWGRLWYVAKRMMDAGKTEAEGGSGVASDFWDWSEAQVKPWHT